MTTTYYDKRDGGRPNLLPEQYAPEAEERGLTVDQLFEQEGMVRGEDGEWQWPEPAPGERQGLRYAYDERDVFRTEDPLGVEVGDRATEDLVLENGITDLGRDEAQFLIRANARVAHVKAINRERERAWARGSRSAGRRSRTGLAFEHRRQDDADDGLQIDSPGRTTGMARNPLDRSAAFTALLELDPEGFGKSSDPETTKTITTFLEDFYESDATNMYTHCRKWLDARDDQVLETARQAEEVQTTEAPTAKPEDPDKPWQVTAEVQRTVDGWESSRQVATFTIPRALAYSKEDAQAKAREIIHPYGEPYDISMDVTTDYVTPERQPEPQAEADRQVLEDDEQQLEAVQEGQAEADAEARGPRGPSASYAEWLAEGQQDPGPGERQLEDWNEHNYQVDGLDPERGE